jgi:PPOX class probable F420-dependent enzyme
MTAPAMGHGVKQRSTVKLTEAEVTEFLAGRRTMSMATLNRDGTIHLVAMWYGFLEGAVAFETKAKAQKVVNLRRDPRLTGLVEDGDSYEELRGVSLVGHAEIVDDPERMFALGVSIFERYQGGYKPELKPFVEAMLRKRVVVKLHVDRVVSWDHRKLGLPSTKPAG